MKLTFRQLAGIGPLAALVGLAGCTAGPSVQVKAERKATPVEVRVVSAPEARVPIAENQQARIYLSIAGVVTNPALGPNANPSQRAVVEGTLIGGTDHWLRFRTNAGRDLLLNR
ncbi:MAG: hypothetical protein AAGK78_03630, partial [Planctomycetota bacterium]